MVVVERQATVPNKRGPLLVCPGAGGGVILDHGAATTCDGHDETACVETLGPDVQARRVVVSRGSRGVSFYSLGFSSRGPVGLPG